MNKYYIKKGNVIRFGKSFKQSDGKLEISDLYFLKHNLDTVEVHPDNTKWRTAVLYILNKDSYEWKDKIRVPKDLIDKYIFKFETDEDALLYEELLE